MEQRPDQPPEGRIIADATDRLNISIREAARRAGISYGRWRQIVMGYQNISPGVYAPVHAPARTVAKMAAVVGITAGQMETEGQRPDVAAILRSESTAPPLHAAPADLLPASEAMEQAMQRHLQELEWRTEFARRRHPGVPLTGQLVFPTDPQNAASWNHLQSDGWDEPTIIRGLAAMTARREQLAALRENDAGSESRRRART